MNQLNFKIKIFFTQLIYYYLNYILRIECFELNHYGDKITIHAHVLQDIMTGLIYPARHKVADISLHTEDCIMCTICSSKCPRHATTSRWRVSTSSTHV